MTLIFKYNKISTMEEKYLSTFHNMDENDIQIIANQMKEYFGNENEELLNVIAQNWIHIQK